MQSTYMVLLTSDYYNLFSRDNRRSVFELIELGHEIGLHFDVTAYGVNVMDFETLEQAMKREISLLEGAFYIQLRSVSWHIPKKELMDVSLEFLSKKGIFNAYDPRFFSGYKYVSDSMMRWREPVEDYINEQRYDRLQILTHPIWYEDAQTRTDCEILDSSLNQRVAGLSRYLDSIRPGYLETQQAAQAAKAM